MNVHKMLGVIMSVLCTSGSAQAQGTFRNLDFEQAAPPFVFVPPTQDTIYASNAIPGWTVYSESIPLNTVLLDSIAFGGAVVILIDSHDMEGRQPIDGQYSVILLGADASPDAAEIGQTGQIPVGSHSLTFLTSTSWNLQVSFNGQPIPLYQLNATANYDVVGGDITAFAGQTGLLLFDAPANSNPVLTGYGLIDDIQFSPTVLPEPDGLCLAAMGALLFGSRRRGIKSPVA